MKWRVIHDDGTAIEWEDPITLADGTVKPAGIRDLDVHTIAQLLTVDDTGLVVHVVTFSPAERGIKIPVWRRITTMSVVNGEATVAAVAAFSGFNELLPDGTERLMLSSIAPDNTVSSTYTAPDGSVSPAADNITLLPHEIHSATEKAAAQALIEADQQRVVADNAVLDTPLTPPDGNSL